MKCDRRRKWKVQNNWPTYYNASLARDKYLEEGKLALPSHTLGPNDKPVKVKARPNGTFDVKVLVSDEPVKEDKKEK